MADINRCIFTGRIGTDTELKTTPSGVSVCTFRLAVERPKAKDAEKAETDWLDIVTWRQQAEFVSRYLGKGRKVVVEGAARTRVWEDKDGKKHKAVEFHATQVVPADSRPQSQNGNTGANKGYTPAPMADFTEVGEDEDLPF